VETIAFYILLCVVVVVPAVALFLARKHRDRGMPKAGAHAHRPHGHHRPGH